MPEINIVEKLRVNDPNMYGATAQEAFGIKSDASADTTAMEFGAAKPAEAQLGELPDAKDGLSVGVYWDLGASGFWRLLLNGGAFRPKGMSFTIANIGWRAGGGWPWYTVPQPRSDFRGSMLIPGAPVHSIVAAVGCKQWQIVSTAGWVDGLSSGCDAHWGVNDDKYDDNTGGFRLWLNGWW